MEGDGVTRPFARRQTAFLGEEAHAAAGGEVRRTAKDLYRPGVRLREADDAFQRRALARAVRADEACDAAWGHREADIVHTPAANVLFGETRDLQRRSHSGCF